MRRAPLETIVGRTPPLRPENLPSGGRFGVYQLVRLIDHGGMGSVYEARNTLGRRIAIKVLQEQFLESDDLIERFLREARFAAAMRHPRIVDVFDVGWSDDGKLPYFAMEFLEGQNLDDFLRKRSGGLDIEVAVRITAQVLDALEAAHDRGVVHRDLKPGNVFLVRPEPEVEVKVLDFGISKVLDEAQALTQAGQILGTPAYMSPEQARGGTVDRRSDLYAAGTLLYELLGGVPPFRGTAHEVLLRKGEFDPPPLASLRADVPQRLLVAVARAMQRSPGRRYATAGEMRTAILSAPLAHDRIEAPRDVLGSGRGYERDTPIAWEVTEKLTVPPQEPLLPASDWSSYEPTRRSMRYSEPPPADATGETRIGPPQSSKLWAAALGGILAGALALAAVALLGDDFEPSRRSSGAAGPVLPPIVESGVCGLRVVVADPIGSLSLDGRDQGARIDLPAPCGERHVVRATAPGRPPRELELEATTSPNPIRIELGDGAQ